MRRTTSSERLRKKWSKKRILRSLLLRETRTLFSLGARALRSIQCGKELRIRFSMTRPRFVSATGSLPKSSLIIKRLRETSLIIFKESRGSEKKPQQTLLKNSVLLKICIRRLKKRSDQNQFQNRSQKNFLKAKKTLKCQKSCQR